MVLNLGCNSHVIPEVDHQQIQGHGIYRATNGGDLIQQQIHRILKDKFLKAAVDELLAPSLDTLNKPECEGRSLMEGEQNLKDEMDGNWSIRNV